MNVPTGKGKPRAREARSVVMVPVSVAFQKSSWPDVDQGRGVGVLPDVSGLRLHGHGYGG
jgi:hypothetical protein